MPDDPVQPDGFQVPTHAERLELLAAMLDLVPDFFYVHDYGMHFRYANRRAYEYFRLPSREALIGRTLEEVDPNPEQARFFVEVCQRIMREGVPRLTDDLPYERADGTRGWLRQHDIPFRHPRTGEPMLMGLSRDVTDEKLLAAERERRAALERELDIARRIQTHLRPTQPPHAPGLGFAGYCEPAAYAGGDFFDWFLSESGAVVVCIADVTGHGVGPALLAAETRAYARALLQRLPLGQAMSRLDESIAPDLAEGRFVTFAAASIDPRTGRGAFVSAGHGPVYLRRAGGTLTRLGVHAPPLGLCGGVIDPPDELALDAGDAIVLLSDGAFEAPGPGAERFGLERTERVIAAHHHARDIVRGLASAVSDFAAGVPAGDDLTVVAVGRETPA